MSLSFLFSSRRENFPEVFPESKLLLKMVPLRLELIFDLRLEVASEKDAEPRRELIVTRFEVMMNEKRESRKRVGGG